MGKTRSLKRRPKNKQDEESEFSSEGNSEGRKSKKQSDEVNQSGEVTLNAPNNNKLSNPNHQELIPGKAEEEAPSPLKFSSPTFGSPRDVGWDLAHSQEVILLAATADDGEQRRKRENIMDSIIQTQHRNVQVRCKRRKRRFSLQMKRLESALSKQRVLDNSFDEASNQQLHQDHPKTSSVLETEIKFPKASEGLSPRDESPTQVTLEESLALINTQSASVSTTTPTSISTSTPSMKGGRCKNSKPYVLDVTPVKFNVQSDREVFKRPLNLSSEDVETSINDTLLLAAAEDDESFERASQVVASGRTAPHKLSASSPGIKKTAEKDDMDSDSFDRPEMLELFTKMERQQCVQATLQPVKSESQSNKTVTFQPTKPSTFQPTKQSTFQPTKQSTFQPNNLPLQGSSTHSEKKAMCSREEIERKRKAALARKEKLKK